MSQPPRFRRYPAEIRATMLVDAGLACLARGGITAFTVDNICRQANTSRGLITHHFGSKDGLLAAVYARAYQPMLENLAHSPDLATLIDQVFADYGNLNVWLALWGQIATNPALQTEHRKNYALYRATVARAIHDLATQRGLNIDAPELATTLIALVDGLWLEHSIDPDQMSPARAKTACRALLEPLLGPLPGPKP
ncbi:MAG: TetR/AcrR family transcriptional regulator [Paracoccaceae bacterium]